MRSTALGQEKWNNRQKMRLTTLEKTDKNTYYRLGKADNGTIKRKIDNRIESDMVFCNDNVSVKGVYADVSQKRAY